MSDFEPRMDKWKSDESVRSLGMQFKDAIFNKGRVEKMRRTAAKKAARRARWKRSWLGRLIAWIWRMIGIMLAVVTLGFIPLVLAWIFLF